MSQAFRLTPFSSKVTQIVGALSDQNLYFHRPLTPAGSFFFCDSLLADESEEPSGPFLITNSSVKSSPLYASPVGFTLVYEEPFLRLAGYDHVRIWYPVAPEGYAALGCCVSTTAAPPANVACLREDLTLPPGTSEQNLFASITIRHPTASAVDLIRSPNFSFNRDTPPVLPAATLLRSVLEQEEFSDISRIASHFDIVPKMTPTDAAAVLSNLDSEGDHAGFSSFNEDRTLVFANVTLLRTDPALLVPDDSLIDCIKARPPEQPPMTGPNVFASMNTKGRESGFDEYVDTLQVCRPADGPSFADAVVFKDLVVPRFTTHSYMDSYCLKQNIASAASADKVPQRSKLAGKQSLCQRTSADKAGDAPGVSIPGRTVLPPSENPAPADSSSPHIFCPDTPHAATSPYFSTAVGFTLAGVMPDSFKPELPSASSSLVETSRTEIASTRLANETNSYSLDPAKQNVKYTFIYMPVSPPGFVALGIVFGDPDTGLPPDDSSVVCVRTDLVRYTTSCASLGAFYDEASAEYIQAVTELRTRIPPAGPRTPTPSGTGLFARTSVAQLDHQTPVPVTSSGKLSPLAQRHYSEEEADHKGTTRSSLSDDALASSVTDDPLAALRAVPVPKFRGIELVCPRGSPFIQVREDSETAFPIIFPSVLAVVYSELGTATKAFSQAITTTSELVKTAELSLTAACKLAFFEQILQKPTQALFGSMLLPYSGSLDGISPGLDASRGDGQGCSVETDQSLQYVSASARLGQALSPQKTLPPDLCIVARQVGFDTWVFSEPEDFRLLYDTKEAFRGQPRVRVYEMLAPPGYAALGCIVCSGGDDDFGPEKYRYACVSEAFVTRYASSPAAYGPSSGMVFPRTLRYSAQTFVRQLVPTLYRFDSYSYLPLSYVNLCTADCIPSSSVYVLRDNIGRSLLQAFRATRQNHKQSHLTPTQSAMHSSAEASGHGISEQKDKAETDTSDIPPALSVSDFLGFRVLPAFEQSLSKVDISLPKLGVDLHGYIPEESIPLHEGSPLMNAADTPAPADKTGDVGGTNTAPYTVFPLPAGQISIRTRGSSKGTSRSASPVASSPHSRQGHRVDNPSEPESTGQSYRKDPSSVAEEQDSPCANEPREPPERLICKKLMTLLDASYYCTGTILVNHDSNIVLAVNKEALQYASVSVNNMFAKPLSASLFASIATAAGSLRIYKVQGPPGFEVIGDTIVPQTRKDGTVITQDDVLNAVVCVNSAYCTRQTLRCDVTTDPSPESLCSGQYCGRPGFAMSHSSTPLVEEYASPAPLHQPLPTGRPKIVNFLTESIPTGFSRPSTSILKQNAGRFASNARSRGPPTAKPKVADLCLRGMTIALPSVNYLPSEAVTTEADCRSAGEVCDTIKSLKAQSLITPRSGNNESGTADTWEQLDDISGSPTRATMLVDGYDPDDGDGIWVYSDGVHVYASDFPVREISTAKVSISLLQGALSRYTTEGTLLDTHTSDEPAKLGPAQHLDPLPSGNYLSAATIPTYNNIVSNVIASVSNARSMVVDCWCRKFDEECARDALLRGAVFLSIASLKVMSYTQGIVSARYPHGNVPASAAASSAYAAASTRKPARGGRSRSKPRPATPQAVPQAASSNGKWQDIASRLPDTAQVSTPDPSKVMFLKSLLALFESLQLVDQFLRFGRDSLLSFRYGGEYVVISDKVPLRAYKLAVLDTTENATGRAKSPLGPGSVGPSGRGSRTGLLAHITDSPCTASVQATSPLWYAVFEKALAKVAGGYTALYEKEPLEILALCAPFVGCSLSLSRVPSAPMVPLYVGGSEVSIEPRDGAAETALVPILAR